MTAHLSLLGYALGGARRRAMRSIALGGGLTAAVALLSAVLFLSDALRAEASRARGAMPDLVVQQMLGGRPSLIAPERAITIAKIPGVASVKPRVWGYVFLPAIQSNVTVIGVSPALARREGVDVLEAGTDLDPDERGVCLLGAELARQLGVQPGDLVRFPAWDDHGPPLKVKGVFRSQISLHTADVVMTSEGDARALLALPAGAVTDLSITLTNPDESAIVAGKVAGMGPGLRVLERRLLERVHSLSYGRRAGFVLGGAIPALLALLVLAWDRVSGLGGAEKREIAILKASGWSTSDVLTTRLYESTLVGALSATIGLVLGYAWIFWLGAPGLREVLAGWSVLYPEAPLTPQVDLAQIAAVLALVIAPFVALSVVPAWRAANIDPMDAMRS